MASEAYELIKRAIQDKEQVVATYQWHCREMCPHILGVKGGRPQALFYQFGGGSSSGLGPDGSDENWRCIPISGLTEVSVRAGDWHTAPTRWEQTCVDVIDIDVRAEL